MSADSFKEAGFDEKQAEAVVRVLAESQQSLVTRDYFDSKIEALEARLTIKLGGMIVVAIGIMATLVKLL